MADAYIPYKPYDLDALRKELRRDEGYRTHLYNDADGKPYESPAGKLTIGIGLNIEDRGLPQDVIYLLLDRCIDEAEEILDRLWWQWRGLDADRQRVLLNMAYNLGQDRLSRFVKMWGCLRAGDVAGAADEMVDSLWYQQVGVRAERLVARMRGGAD